MTASEATKGQILVFAQYDHDFRDQADVVVVGSGPCGSVVAHEIAKAGRSVILLEEGPPFTPADFELDVSLSMARTMREGGLRTTRGTVMATMQANALGGGSLVNSAICVRTPGDIFRQWRDQHGVGGDAYADRLWKYQDLIERELHVEEVPAHAMGRSNQLALLGDQRANLGGHVMRRYVKGCAGSGQCLQGCKGLKKQSTNLNYVPETMTRGGVVLSCAPADKILLDGQRAIGVTGHFQHPTTS